MTESQAIDAKMTARTKRVKASSFPPLYELRLIRRRCREKPYPELLNTQHAAAQFIGPQMNGRDRETLLVIYLDTRNHPIGMEVAGLGSLNASLVHPREIFKGAILANAASIIVSHNHPSGDPSPSEEDLKITRMLYKAGELLGIELLDHIVWGGPGRYVSLKERGDLVSK